jgi:plasmid stabilization system protein ParE
MSEEPGYVLHPLAAQDITEIWEYIAADNPLAARRVREELHTRIRALVPFPNQGLQTPAAYVTSLALRSCARLPDCLRAR